MRHGTIARHLGAAAWVLAVASCSGDGCACISDIPEGFPDEARQPGAVQARLSESGLDVVNANMSELASVLLEGDGPIEFPIPRDCSSDPKVCCYVADGSCRLRFDIAERAGDLPRLFLEPLGGNRVQLTIRARIRTASSLPVHATGPLGGEVACWVYIDSTWSGYPHVTVRAVVALEDDPITGTTRGRVVSSTLAGITSGDVDISGGLLCGFGSTQDAADSMNVQLQQRIPAAVEDLLCATCDSDVDCAPHGTCAADGVCYLPGTGGRCLQDFGLSGRLAATAALGDLPTDRADAIDLYLTAGGGARSNGGGLSIDVLAGARPARSVSVHDCVPPAPEPAGGAIAASTVLAGNTHPRSGAPFDLGIGIHRQFLDHAGWAAQQAGFLCLDVGPAEVPLLSAEALSILAPSLIDLTHGEDAPLYLLVRPQEPPTFALGAGTLSGGAIDEPLIELSMRELEIDFYAFIDQQYARILTLRADLDVPIALDVDGDGAVLPVLGDLADAFTNLRVINSGLLAEPPDEIERRFPAVLSVALPAFSDALSSFEVPAFAGMTLELRPGSFAAIENDSMLGIFGDLAPAASPARVTATATVSVREQRDDRVALTLGGDAGGAPLEWSVRLDGGFWSPYSTDARPVLTRKALHLVGTHILEVRARQVGEPLTTGQPVAIELVTAAPPRLHRAVEFHGTADSSGGCDCRLGATDQRSGAGLLLLLGIVVAGLGRRRWLLALAPALLLLACSSHPGDDDGDGGALDPTVVNPGPTGRWASMAADDVRVVLAAYEQDFGDLVVATIEGEGRPGFQVVDGAPDGPVLLDPAGYRGGVNAPGPDVGAYTSIALAAGEARIAYQDRDRGALRYAREDSAGWIATDVDVPATDEPATRGLYASLATDADGLPAIAYMTMTYVAPETEDEPGAMRASLQLARATSARPAGPDDWAITVIDEATAPVVDGFEDVPVGTGLHASLGFLSSGAAVIAYYRATTGELMLAAEGADGFELVALDTSGDRGRYASMAIGADDTVHVAYQDAVDDRLLATTYAGGMIGRPEVIDDGRRAGDRPHAVGAAVRLVLVGGVPVVAYQDGTTADLLWSARSDGDGWSGGEVMTGELGYGFHIAAAAAAGGVWCSTYAYDPARWPPGHTEVRRLEL